MKVLPYRSWNPTYPPPHDSLGLHNRRKQNAFSSSCFRHHLFSPLSKGEASDSTSSEYCVYFFEQPYSCKVEAMSLLAKLFGSGKNKDKAPTPQEGIQRLREVEEMLMKKSDFLEKKIEQELTTAKKMGTKNKRAALAALKRKKRFEKQLQQIDGTLTTIEFQREALENASTNTEVLKVMGVAAKALKGAHNNLDVDKVHDLMDEVAEQQEIANEISDAISNPVGFGQDQDEDDLLAELEELEQEEIDEQLIGVPTPSAADTLPSVPTDEISVPSTSKSKAKAQEDDDELKELEMWAS